MSDTRRVEAAQLALTLALTALALALGAWAGALQF
jgi:hypothetical protein